jgi:predicted ArsR family transcriptional regulator
LIIEKEFNNLPETSKLIIIELSQRNWVNLRDLVDNLWIKEVTIREHIRKLLEKNLIQKHSKLKRDINAFYTL